MQSLVRQHKDIVIYTWKETNEKIEVIWSQTMAPDGILDAEIFFCFYKYCRLIREDLDTPTRITTVVNAQQNKS